MLNISFAFFSGGGLDYAFTGVGPSSNWGVLSPKGIIGYAASTMGVSSLSINVCFLL